MRSKLLAVAMAPALQDACAAQPEATRHGKFCRAYWARMLENPESQSSGSTLAHCSTQMTKEIGSLLPLAYWACMLENREFESTLAHCSNRMTR